MKTRKFFASSALALSMALTPAAMLNALPVVAAEVVAANSVTVKNDTGHVFEAYQIFSGSQTKEIKDDKEVYSPLGNIAWGTGIDSVELLTKLVASDITDLKNAASQPGVRAQDIANALKEVDVKKFADIVRDCVKGEPKTIGANSSDVTLDPGYYLFKDVTSPEDVADQDAYSFVLLKVSNGVIELTVKKSVPTPEKKVSDDEDGNNNAESKYKDVADHEIGEEFTFQLTANLPDEEYMNDYKTYTLVFNDTLSKGITAKSTTNSDDQTQVVTIDSVEIIKTDTNKVSYAPNTFADKAITPSVITTNPDETTSFNVKIDDVKKLLPTGAELKGTKVVVTYTAVLNSNAVIRNDGIENKNTLYLQYSNNPYEEGLGKSNNDTVFVGTYELPAKKMDNTDDNIKLSGAQFKLKNKAGKYAVVDEENKLTGWSDSGSIITSGTDGKFGVKGLDAGTYTLVEVTPPAGYQLPANPETAITVKAPHPEEEYNSTDNPTFTVTFEYEGSESNTTQINIKNSKAGSLPETGGMGTTMFYIAGTALVAGAAVIFVTNKRTRRN